VHFYDATAQDYEQWAGGLHRKIAGRLVEVAGPRPDERCLDVGCGTGLVSNDLAVAVGPGGQVIGIDVSGGMLTVARARAQPNTDYQQVAAGAELWFRQGSFDLVTFGDSISYLGDPGAMLRESRRVVREGGRIALSVRRHSLETPAQEVFFGLLDELIETHPIEIPKPRDGRSTLGEPDVLRRSLTEAGFEVLADSTMVTGARLNSAAAWVDLMAGAGPRPYLYLTSLGTAFRHKLEEAIDREMRRLGDGAFHYHEAFSFAVGRAA
jgi:SAM-dependent methyltransferase